jgi:hypothetical protein
MTNPANFEASYLPATWNFSEDKNDFLRELNTLYRKIAQSVADREIGRYDCVDQAAVVTPPGFERSSGQKWPGSTNQNPKPGFRKVVNFPALVAGNNTQPHNLGAITSYTFTRIDGVLQNAAASRFVPVPNGGPNYAFCDVNGANVEITLAGGSPWAGYTAIVVLEYLKN